MSEDVSSTKGCLTRFDSWWCIQKAKTFRIKHELGLLGILKHIDYILLRYFLSLKDVLPILFITRICFFILDYFCFPFFISSVDDFPLLLLLVFLHKFSVLIFDLVKFLEYGVFALGSHLSDLSPHLNQIVYYWVINVKLCLHRCAIQGSA